MKAIRTAFRMVLCDYLGHHPDAVEAHLQTLEHAEPHFVYTYLRSRALDITEPHRTELMREVAKLLEIKEA